MNIPNLKKTEKVTEICNYSKSLIPKSYRLIKAPNAPKRSKLVQTQKLKTYKTKKLLRMNTSVVFVPFTDDHDVIAKVDREML